MANKILNLDFSKDPIMPPIIYGRVGDEKMQTITVKISRRDEIPDLSGGIITFEGEPAGGKVKVFDSENVSSNNAGLQKGTFEYTFPSAAFSVEGTYKRAYFSFQKDGKRDTTGDFKIIVKGNADIDAGEAETIITEYNKLVKALNEAYQAALNKMNTDYDDVEKRIEAIKVDLNTLKKQITDILVDAEGRISAIGKSVTDEVDAALEKFKEGNFYTKQEADNRFLSKTENLDIQNKKLTNDDGSGLPLPKGVTSFKELSGYAGFYYLNATVAGTMTDKADLPPEFKYSALYVYQHAIAGTAGSMYQEIRMNSLATPLIAFRTTSPNSSQNSPFKVLATTDNVYTKNESDEKYISKQEFNNGLTKAVGFGTESDYTVSSSGVVVIPITTSYIDDEIFSINSNKITVKKSGLVAINLSWLIDSKSSSSSWINGELYKNSTPWARINHEVKMRQPGAISNLVLVNSGDTFHFQTNSDNSGYIVRQLRAYILFIKDINEVT